MSRKKKADEALVHIQPLPIPPLHQSTELVMSCQLFYVESIIKGRKKPGGLESARGNQVHKVHADYDAWCATKGVEMDLDAFDQFAKGVGPTATKILLGMRETHRVDFRHLLATELMMALDENFNPTELPAVLEGVVEDSGNPPHYQGTLDALFLFKENNTAAIHDAKTHPRPYDPSDPEKALQGKMYSLFVFLHFPWVEEVTFKLIFVRFRDLVREVVYKRSDLPSLIESVRAARELQRAIHAVYAVNGNMQATPGAHCQYCPLLSDRSCPIGQFNENMQLSDEDRLRFKIWDAAFGRINTKVLADRVNATGKNVVVKDYNGKSYTFGPEPSTSEIMPLFQATATGIAMDKEGNPVMPAVSLLMDYAHSTPDDTEWMGKITISSSSMSTPLKAKRRVHIHQALQDVVEKVPKVRLKVSKPLDSIPDEEPDDDESEFGEETEF